MKWKQGLVVLLFTVSCGMAQSMNANLLFVAGKGFRFADVRELVRVAKLNQGKPVEIGTWVELRECAGLLSDEQLFLLPLNFSDLPPRPRENKDLKPGETGPYKERNDKLNQGKKIVEGNLKDKKLMPQEPQGQKGQGQVGPVSFDVVRSVMQMYLISPDDYRLPPGFFPADEPSLNKQVPPVYTKDPGAAVMVGVLDTAAGPSESADDYSLTKQGNPYMIGHGFPIGKLIQQVASKATLHMRYKDVCNQEGLCADSDVIRAICSLYEDATKLRVPLVINLSLGDTQPSEVLEYVMRKASAKGVLFAAAAGNMELMDKFEADCEQTCTPHPQPVGNFKHSVDFGDGFDKVFPASYNGSIGGVIAVGSLQLEGNNQYSRAPSSWRADWVSVSAPGRGLMITGTPSPYYQGTSFATPIVTATLALLRSKYPAWDSGRIVSHLISNCTYPDVTGTGVGKGRVDPNKTGCL